MIEPIVMCAVCKQREWDGIKRFAGIRCAVCVAECALATYRSDMYAEYVYRVNPGGWQYKTTDEVMKIMGEREPRVKFTLDRLERDIEEAAQKWPMVKFE